jgi:hypothetical protein
VISLRQESCKPSMRDHTPENYYPTTEVGQWGIKLSRSDGKPWSYRKCASSDRVTVELDTKRLVQRSTN